MPKKKFNDEIVTRILTFYENGLPLKYASELAGVHRTTVYKWLDKGKKARSGKYRQFYLDLQKAKAKFIAFHVNKLNESDDTWTSKYLLEVTDPDTFVIEKKLKTSNDTELKMRDVKPLKERIEEYENYYSEIEQELESDNQSDNT